MSLASGTRVGPYEILSPLGAGSMGEVYRARDTKLNRDVALKVLPDLFTSDPDRLARFQREAQVLASLNHPHIAGIYGLEDSGGVHALVLELVEGPTLADRIARGPIPISEALPLARQIARALEAAHEKGIVHRDFKPANIKVTPEGNVKVLDFGLAKLLDTDAASSLSSMSPTITSPAVTRQGVILGTAGYMAPEQTRGKPVDRRADIWAFGCVLYEMLAGKRTFGGDEISDTLAFVIMREPDWSVVPAETPAAIRRVLRRCLEKDRERRLQHIGDARLDIDEALAAPSAEATPAVEAPRRSHERLAWTAAAVFCATFVAAAALAVVLYVQRAPVDAPTTRFFVYLKSSSGAGAGDTLYSDDLGKTLPNWSPDSRFILYTGTGTTGADLWFLPLSGDRKPFPFLQTPFNETQGQFSPNGRWIAYVSNDSGTDQVYVAPFPGPGGKSLVSTGGGTWPRWRRDGRELFYLAADNKVMAAAVNGQGAGFEVGAVRSLFAVRAAGPQSFYDVSSDGQRFLVNTVGEQAASAPITVVLNWRTGLRK